MRVPVPINVVVVGPPKAGKSAFSKRLCLKKFTEVYTPTVGVDFLVCMDNQKLYKFNLWDLSGATCFKPVVKHYAKDADILIFVINPLAKDYPLQKQKFLQSLQAEYKLNLRYGYLVLFSHDDLWLADPKINADFKAYKKELIAAASNRIHIFSVSAINLNADRVFRAMLELIKPQELQLYSQYLKDKLDRFQLSSQRRLVFKAHISRSFTLNDLQQDVARAANQMEIVAALISAARDIRTPGISGEDKYGFRLFGQHYRSHKNSGLYKLLKAELALIAPHINLEAASLPALLQYDSDVEEEKTPQLSPA
jgi:GTPase SAR1 family protein